MEQAGILVMDASGKEPVFRLPGNAAQIAGQFSPDERFIAYVSNESGAAEVYVQTWPTGGGKWQISNGGGSQPRWSAHGNELFYRNPEFQFFAVPVTLAPRFSAGIPKPLFKRRLKASNQLPWWSVAADGQRFLLNASTGEARSSPFTVILNWPETLSSK